MVREFNMDLALAHYVHHSITAGRL
jgi:hypothetical protein